MSKELPIKKLIQSKLHQFAVGVFEELSGTKASRKASKTLDKKAGSVSKAIRALVKKESKKKEKVAKKAKKALAKQSKNGAKMKKAKNVPVPVN
jgi:hypothetical protein